MASQFLPFGATELDLGAAAQQLCVIAAIRAHRLAAILPLLLPDGEIRESDIDPGTWPPSWVILRAGPGDWLIVLEGTTNVQQGAWHTWGTFAYESDEGGGLVNGQWSQLVPAILARVLANGGDSPGVSWRIAGHSYGGAVAELLAEAIQAARPLWTVSVLQMAAPRARGEGYDGRLPSPFWRLESTGDPVPLLPPAGPYPYGAAPTLFPGLILQYVGWSHYSEQRVIWPNGGIGSGFTPDPLPNGVANGLIDTHYIENYVGRLRANYDSQGGSTQFAAALSLFDIITSGNPPTQTVVPGLPGTIPLLPSGPTVENPLYTAPEEASIMAGPYPTLLPATGSAYRVTLLLNQGEDGVSESYLWYVATPGAIAYNTIKTNLVPKMIAARIKFLPANTDVVGVRIGIDNGGGAITLKANNGVFATGLLNEATADINNCVNIRLIPDALKPTARTTVRALTASQAAFAVGTSRTSVSAGTKINAFLTTLRQLMGLVPFANVGVPGIQAVMRTYDRNPDTNPLFSEITASYSSDCRVVLTSVGQITYNNGIATVPAKPGTMFKMAVKRQKCVTGLAGTASVIRVVAGTGLAAGTWAYTMDKGFCCGADALERAVVAVQVKQPRYTPVVSLEFNGYSTRDSGGAFFQRSGKSGGKCC